MSQLRVRRGNAATPWTNMNFSCWNEARSCQDDAFWFITRGYERSCWELEQNKNEFLLWPPCLVVCVYLVSRADIYYILQYFLIFITFFNIFWYLLHFLIIIFWSPFIRGRPRLGWMDGVKVALGNRGMTVEAARQCAKDRKALRTLVHV